MRRLVVLNAWWCAAIIVLGLAASSREGRVVYVLSPTHGIHTGDLVGMAAATVWALRVTWGQSRRGRAAT